MKMKLTMMKLMMIKFVFEETMVKHVILDDLYYLIIEIFLQVNQFFLIKFQNITKLPYTQTQQLNSTFDKPEQAPSSHDYNRKKSNLLIFYINRLLRIKNNGS